MLNLPRWKEIMAKQSNGDPESGRRAKPTATRKKEDRIKEVEKLETRGMLLRALQVLGDERVSDDQLRRALIVLEGLDVEGHPEA